MKGAAGGEVYARVGRTQAGREMVRKVFWRVNRANLCKVASPEICVDDRRVPPLADFSSQREVCLLLVTCCVVWVLTSVIVMGTRAFLSKRDQRQG